MKADRKTAPRNTSPLTLSTDEPVSACPLVQPLASLAPQAAMKPPVKASARRWPSVMRGPRSTVSRVRLDCQPDSADLVQLP